MDAQTIQESFEARVARERLEERKRQENVEALIEAACGILGFTLRERPDQSWNWLSLNAQKGDESLRFSSGGYQMKDRIKIAGNFPRTERGERIDPYSYNEKPHEITVSIDKTAAQIAKDIERRFLPRYRALLQAVAERVIKSNEYARKCLENLESIKGESATDEERKAYRFMIGGPIYGEIAVSEETAGIDLHSVPIHIAKKIVKLVSSEGGCTYGM